MPFLFYPERVGYRDEPCQPWEGTRGDWYDLEPEVAARFLPFPDSPLDNKGQDVVSPAKPHPKRARSMDGLPELGHSYIPHLGVTQALRELQYTVIEGSTVHQQIARFWVLPRNQLPAEAHVSPPFVRKQWDSQSDIPAPSWARIDTNSTAWKVLPLREAVRTVVHYACKRVNQENATDLQSWAYGMTPKSSASHSSDLWPLSTPPRTRKSLRPAKSTRPHAERFHYDAVF
ncbi:hypothetical protein FB451DRAFT_369460 [Mycena latifolia]|nr:hypothetical protein FB451DRAFT_368029 [Mycena latifolia]KAJ7469130.1 hypothetical protein FB451DRAFT_369460 [Mycena latifolia]